MFGTRAGEETTRLATAALGAAGLPAEPDRWEIVDRGTSHVVVLDGDRAAVRVARDPRAAQMLEPRQRLVDALPALPFTVPRSLGPVTRVGDSAAVAVERVPGDALPVGTGEPDALRTLLEALWEVDPEPLREMLAEPLSFCGGDAWHRVQVDRVIPLLPPQLQEAAVRAVDALASLEPEEPVLSHGDLGGHNVHWSDGRVVGVLDWDLAAASDRSTDLATLGVWHGWHLLADVAEPAQVRRALIRRNTFALQQVAFYVVNDRPHHEVESAVARASEFIGEHLVEP